MIGGADEAFLDDRRRDRLIPAKTRRLMRRARALFPSLRPQPAFAWAGTFATTADGIGFVGPLRSGSRVLYALGFGGNGITGSATACALLTDHIMGRPNRDSSLLAFDRRA
jgi:glycine/D-amino acid oxidase-like deaminating enzyme